MLLTSSTITAFDGFCGAGGSSTAMRAAGINVRYAANHWALAIETHNTNHPNTDHYLDDLQQVHPSVIPRTTIAWFSPECTNHSLAKGKKRKGINQLDLWGNNEVDPAEERSRATMREVVEFSAYHHYEAVIVENVVDIRHWQHFDSWMQEMINLGYHCRILYLNAMFLGVPQSRDRFYAVFWKKGNKAPNLDFRPWANCPEHGQIRAVQSWKKSDFPWGRHGSRRQYVYRCPKCAAEVMPAFSPASSVIDWSIPSTPIGERNKPLKDKTIKRILAGLKKFGQWPVVADLGHSHAADSGKVQSVWDPLATQTTRQTLALVEPFIASQHEGRDAVREIRRELPCITTMNNEHALIVPPLIMSHHSNPVFKPTDEAMPTIMNVNHHALVVPPFLTSLNHSTVRNTSVESAMPTVMPHVTPSLVTPPFLAQLKGDRTATGADEPLSTIVASASQQALISPPFVMSYYGTNPTFASVDDPLPTMRTVQHQALVTPEQMLPQCGFRMLEPKELKLGQSFPENYVVLGSKRDQVRQIGNAVACNVAQWIAERVVESLS